MSEPDLSGGLPGNAYRELAAGEVYVPIVPADAKVTEVTARSIVFGLVMTSIFSEATATTEILVAGGRGGRQALVLLSSMAVGFTVDFLALHFKAWRDTFTTVLIPSLHKLTDDVKAIFVLNTSAAVLGLGYIVGLRYATIIAAGSLLSYYVLVPLVAAIPALTPAPLL